MKKKEAIITFKVNEDLREVISNIPNRSEFIRAAIMTALDNVCPLCNGTGILSPKQKDLPVEFAQNHAVRRCEDCHELIIECANSTGKPE